MLAILFLLFVLLVDYSFRQNSGVMLSDEQGVALYDDAMSYWEMDQTSPDSIVIPASIAQLKPAIIKKLENGLLLIFYTPYVEHHGFYYADNDGPAIQFCDKKLAPGFIVITTRIKSHKKIR